LTPEHGYGYSLPDETSMKKLNSVQQFTALRSALTSERETLQARLRQIDSAFSGAVLSPEPAPTRRGRPPGKANQAMSASAPARKPRRKMSAEARAKIGAAQKLRWSKTKADSAKKPS